MNNIIFISNDFDVKTTILTWYWGVLKKETTKKGQNGFN